VTGQQTFDEDGGGLVLRILVPQIPHVTSPKSFKLSDLLIFTTGIVQICLFKLQLSEQSEKNFFLLSD